MEQPLFSGLVQDRFQSRQQQHDILFSAAETHQANPPDFALQRAKSTGNFDIVFFEQPAAHGPGRLRRREFAGWSGSPAGKKAAPVAAGPSHPDLPRNSSALARWRAKRCSSPSSITMRRALAQGIMQADRSGVVIGVRLSPVLFETVQIQVPIGRPGSLRFLMTSRPRSLTVSGAKARRAGQALLCPAVRHIDAPVDRSRPGMPPSDVTVSKYQQRAASMSRGGNLRDARLQSAGGGLCMHQCDQLVSALL